MSLSSLDNFYINTYGPTGSNILHNFYPMNEASGSVIDQINANNGTNTGVTQGSTGFLPTPDGDTCYTSSGTDLIVTNSWVPYPLSWECWIYPNSVTGDGAIITQGSPGIYLAVGATNLVQLTNLVGGAGTVWSGTVPLSTATHLVLTTDGSSTAANTKLYRNGVLQSQNNFTTPQAFTSPIGVLCNYSGGSVTAYNGKICKVCMYSQILTQAQITANYNAGLNGVSSAANTGFFGFM